MKVAPRTGFPASIFDPETVLGRLSNVPRYTRCFGSTARSPFRYERASTLARRSGCPQCSRRLLLSSKNNYSTRTPSFFSPGTPNNAGRKQSEPGRSQRKGLKYVIIGGVVVAGAAAFSDQVRHGYCAAERTGRVVGALAVCINE